MDDESFKLFKTLCALIGISTLASASRTILSEDRRSLVGFLRGFILAVFVGVIVGALIQDYNFTSSTQSGIVGVSAFIADDILMGLLKLSQIIRNDPLRAFNFILRRDQK